MKRILRKQKSGYALALLLCLVGVALLVVSLWKAWPEIYSTQNPFWAFWLSLWTQNLVVILGFEFKLGYFVILGIVSIVAGILVWILSRQWFAVPGETVLFQCPFCKRQWRALRDKALVHCPHCRQLVHPIMVES